MTVKVLSQKLLLSYQLISGLPVESLKFSPVWASSTYWVPEAKGTWLARVSVLNQDKEETCADTSDQDNTKLSKVFL